MNPRTLLPALAVAAALFSDVSAQNVVVELRDMSGSRGLVGQGPGGFTGPPFEPIAGHLGQSCVLIDANGDGLDDLLVGAPTVPKTPSSGVPDDAGHAYLLFGSADKGAPGSSPDVNIATIAAAGLGVDFRGQPGDRVGFSVANAGDINDDGIDDMIIGTPGRSVSRTASGGAYVVFGSPSLTSLALVDLQSFATTSSAVYFEGAKNFGAAGTSVSGNVDVDSDGISDVIIGAPLESTDLIQQAGAAYIVFGVAGIQNLSSIDLGALVAGDGTVVRGSEPFQLLGQSVAGIGRFDPVLPLTNNQTSATLGDDVAIGAPGTSPAGKLFAGAVYVLRGSTSTPVLEYSAAQFGNGTNKAGIVYTGAEAGDQAGFDVARAGNMLFDAQLYDDLIFTAPFNDGTGKPNSGTTYVVPGRFVGVNPQGFDLSTIEVQTGVAIYGAQSNDGKQGVFASTAGDWTADGRTELAVGHANATYAADGSVAVGAGRIRILDINKSFLGSSVIDLSLPPEDVRVFELAGESNLAFGGASLCTGDFNGDGFADLGIGAPGAPSDPNPLDLSGVAFNETGRAHILYGPVFRLGGIFPDRGSQYAGVYNPGLKPDYAGLPAQEVEIVVNAGSIFTIDDISVAEIGSDAVGWRDIELVSVDFPNVIALVPPHLLGTTDVTVNLRMTVKGQAGTSADVYTYEASAFREISEFAQPGFGVGGEAPRLLMAGDFLENGQVLVVQDQWPPEVELAVLVFGPALLANPPTVKGGLFPVQFLGDFVQFFPFAGAPGFDFSIDMPFFIDPALEGTSVFLHYVTREKSGNQVRWGFSNVLEATFVLGGF